VKSSPAIAPVALAPVAAAAPGPERVISPAAAAPAMIQATMPAAPPATTQKPAPFTPSAPVEVAADASARSVPRASIAGPVAVEPPVRPAAETVTAKSPPPAPKLAASKPTKAKQVYYNIVGEPMPSDED
jgi:DNA polymerase-3 subunit gamma/tau